MRTVGVTSGRWGPGGGRGGGSGERACRGSGRRRVPARETSGVTLQVCVSGALAAGSEGTAPEHLRAHGQELGLGGGYAGAPR